MKFSYKTIRLLSLTLIVAVLLSQTQLIGNLLTPKKAYAVGDLTVSWEGAGSGDTGPMFSIANMAPGQTSQKTITVTNSATTTRPVGIRGVKTAGLGALENVLEIVISKNGTDLYGGTTGVKSLSQFLTDSASPNGISLGQLNSGATGNYVVKVTFVMSADNTYQNTSLTFNLIIGLSLDIPAACHSMDLDFAHPIMGSSKSEKLTGTDGNDLILALEGSDVVDGKNGDDCIIGGSGSDSLKGGSGKDVLFGDAGSDKLDGGNDEDKIFGGDGSDALVGGNAKDELYGENGSDSLKGESGNDILIGGAHSDSANGGANTDTCVAEAKTSCEL